MVASSGVRVGQYPARVGEVKWTKKISVYRKKYVKKGGGQQMCPLLAPCHTSLLASNICQYMPGKTREYGNKGAKKTCKKLTILSRALDGIAIYAIKKRTSNIFYWFGPHLRHPTATHDDPKLYWAHFKTSYGLKQPRIKLTK